MRLGGHRPRRIDHGSHRLPGAAGSVRRDPDAQHAGPVAQRVFTRRAHPRGRRLGIRGRSGYGRRSDPRRHPGRQRVLGKRLLSQCSRRHRDARTRDPVPVGKPGEPPRPHRLAGCAHPRRRAVSDDLRLGEGAGMGLGHRPHPRCPRARRRIAACRSSSWSHALQRRSCRSGCSRTARSRWARSSCC